MAIVGAGPAGARAACQLARRGARVVIFDPSHPREKPCGGGVTGRALDLLSPTIPAVAAIPRVQIETARFETDGRSDAVVELAPAQPADPALVVARRRDLDATLLATALEAGARLVPERVADVHVGTNGVELRTASGRLARAAFLLAADGATSLVRRRVAAPFRRQQLSIATGYFAHGVSSREIVIRLTAEPPGYCWSFPRPDHLAIGICSQADLTDVASLRREVKAWIAGTVSAASNVRLERYSWPIPSLGAADIDRERPAGSRWLLLGDAAGLVDPITREGIYFALRSADLAVTALSGTRDPGAAYTAGLRDGIYAELRRAAYLKRAFFAPRFLRLLHDALRQSAAVRAVMADLVSGRQPYRGLKRRLLSTLEVRLAWRLLWRRS